MPSLGPLIDLLYSSPTDIVFEDDDTQFNIKGSGSVAKGNALSGAIYSMVQAEAIKNALAQFPNIKMSGIMDDKYIMGDIKESFQAFDKYKVELGILELNVLETKCIALHVVQMEPNIIDVSISRR